MPIAVVRLGSPRRQNEGLRIGTVRRPPRGVPKVDFAKRDFYDVWLPDLSPSHELVTFALESHDVRSCEPTLINYGQVGGFNKRPL